MNRGSRSSLPTGVLGRWAPAAAPASEQPMALTDAMMASVASTSEHTASSGQHACPCAATRTPLQMPELTQMEPFSWRSRPNLKSEEQNQPPSANCKDCVHGKCGGNVIVVVASKLLHTMVARMAAGSFRLTVRKWRGRPHSSSTSEGRPPSPAKLH